MKHPSHYFIKYLLISLPLPTKEVIDSNLLLYGMAPIDKEAFEVAVREVEKAPEDFRPWDRKHKVSGAWLREQKIFGLVHQERSIEKMKFLIFSNPPVRQKIEGMLLGNVSPDEVSYRLAQMEIRVDTEAVAAYKQYFWNTDELEIVDWIQYFNADDRVGPSKSLYSASLFAGPEVALYRAGVENSLDSKKILQDIQRELYHTFLETKNIPLSPKKVSMLTDLSRGLTKIDERIQAGDTALQETLKKFEKFKINTPQQSFPKIAELRSVSKRKEVG